jgi:hypothetical protein
MVRTARVASHYSSPNGTRRLWGEGLGRDRVGAWQGNCWLLARSQGPARRVGGADLGLLAG